MTSDFGSKKYGMLVSSVSANIAFAIFSAIQSQIQSYVTTEGQSASLSWLQAPIWGPRSDCYYCQTVTGLLMRGALSDERTGLSFTIPAGHRQRSHSRVRVPQGS
jgi:hypothetical protein